MQFKDLVGHQSAGKGLIQLWDKQKWPHALLIAAQEGRGGLPLALACVQYVFCTQKTQEDSCGVCANCQKVSHLSHPDLHLSFPSISPKPNTKASSKYFLPAFREFVAQTPYGSTFDWLQHIQAENKQGNITAEECREIIDQLNLSAFEGGAKVQLIWRPEYLGKEGNILLKLIEEPPANTYLILVVEDVGELLPTIVSRTQQVILPPIPAKEIAAGLVSRQDLEERKAAQVAQLASGSYARALQLLGLATNDLLEPLKRWFNGIFTDNGILLHEWIEYMDKSGREQQKNFLLFTQQLLGHAFRTRFVPGYHPSLPDDETIFVGKLAQRKLSPEVFQRMNEALDKAVYQIERNVHSKTVLLHLSVQFQYLINGKMLVV